MDEKRVVKGRGAISNPAGRFERTPSAAVADGWDLVEDEAFAVPDPRTTFTPDQTRDIIATNNSPDIPFGQSVNPYKGCEHGCVYCYARPTHAFLDLSPGLDFETRIFYKTGPAERLREAFDSPGYECRTLAIGTNTDPYQPGEKQYRVTRPRPRDAAGIQAPGQHRHQGRADPARPRHPGCLGGRRPHECRHQYHHPGQRPEDEAGTTHGVAWCPAAHRSGIGTGWSTRRRHGGPGDPVHQ